MRRPAVFALATLVLLYQVVAGVFAGGTVLCIGGSGGMALQPVGMTCCVLHAESVTLGADSCDDDCGTCVSVIPVVGCEGCTDHALNAEPTLPPLQIDVALPAIAAVLIAIVPWPEAPRRFTARALMRGVDRAPPLAFLSTVILRC